MEILDCTLRDGGYYTNWDFNQKLIDGYLDSINKLPIDIIEIGYRNPKKTEYLGEYFYCPQYVLDHITKRCNKKIAIMLNEKDVRPEMLPALLKGCEKIDVVRMAIDPKNFKRALVLAKAVKEHGFTVALNVMYMSQWSDHKDFLDLLPEMDGVADYFNMVDSFGGVYPEDVKSIYADIVSKTKVKIGFHGHNNLELGLVNSLTAIDCGADIIDATITGMGRGAGNLKTELLLTAMNAKYNLDVDFNILGNVVNEFEELKKQYHWGTNLPYMIAGANSFPQKEVMEWVTNRVYSFNSIIRTLQNKKDGKKDNLKLPLLDSNEPYSKAIIVGGGPSAILHARGIINYLNQNQDVAVIHASAKNAKPYKDIKNHQYFCLVGNEGRRLESTFESLGNFKGHCILPPYPRKMGTYIPKSIKDQCVELKEINFTTTLLDTHTAIAIQAAIDLNIKEILLVGYDGYTESVTKVEQELSKENELLFGMATKKVNLKSLFPTAYNLPVESIYALINE